MINSGADSSDISITGWSVLFSFSPPFFPVFQFIPSAMAQTRNAPLRNLHKGS